MDFVEILIRIMLFLAGIGLLVASSQVFGQAAILSAETPRIDTSFYYVAVIIMGFIGLGCVVAAFYHIRRPKVDVKIDWRD
jgi:hypothetical protein